MNDNARNRDDARNRTPEPPPSPAGGGITSRRRSNPEDRRPWSRPTVRIMEIGQTASGSGGSNIQEGGPYGVTWGDPS